MPRIFIEALNLYSNIEIENAGRETLEQHIDSEANVSASGINDGAVTLAKMADLAQDKMIIRTTASTGVPQTATVTAAARTVLDDTTVGAMVDTLGGASATGTGGLARAGGPTFTAPVLGTPASGVLTNCTGTAAGLTAGAATLAADSTKVANTTPSAAGLALLSAANLAAQQAIILTSLPPADTYTLKSVSGVLTWVIDA